MHKSQVEPSELKTGERITIAMKPALAALMRGEHGPVEFLRFEPPDTTGACGKVWYRCHVAGEAYAEYDKCDFFTQRMGLGECIEAHVAAARAPAPLDFNYIIRKGEEDGSRGRWEPPTEEWERVLYSTGHKGGDRKRREESGEPGTNTRGFMAEAFQKGIEDAGSGQPVPDYKTRRMLESYNAGLVCGKLPDDHIATLTVQVDTSQAEAALGRLSEALKAVPATPPLTQSELLKVIADVVCAARSEELQHALDNVRHWRERCGALEARLKVVRDAAK